MLYVVCYQPLGFDRAVGVLEESQPTFSNRQSSVRAACRQQRRVGVVTDDRHKQYSE
jgi:hypothetical protein